MKRLLLLAVLGLCIVTSGCTDNDNDSSNLLYLLLFSDNTIEGIVTTLAGPASGDTTSGDKDATGNGARFNNPKGLVAVGTNLYVTDATNNKIRRISLITGNVTTIAGPSEGSSASGDADGTGTVARFNNPIGITTDGTNLYICDVGNHKIRKIVPANGAVTTFAGPAEGDTSSGDDDGTGNDARFFIPAGIACDGTNLYVTEGGNNKIRKIVISSRDVTTLAGPAPGSSAPGDNDGTGNMARFDYPSGITTDGTNLYVADYFNNKVRKIVITNRVVSTLAGPAPGATTSGDADDTGNAARFHNPSGITVHGSFLFVSEVSNNKIRKIDISTGEVTTLAGPAEGSSTSGDNDGTGNDARFNAPIRITSNGSFLYVADVDNNKIRKID